MKKQFSILMISLSWVLWFVSVFSFPVTIDSSGFPVTIDSSGNDYAHDSVSNLAQLTKIQFNAPPELLEIPEFKVAWSLNAKLNPHWYFDFLSPYKVCLPPSFFKKSIPLFDIKDIFIHFFYPW